MEKQERPSQRGTMRLLWMPAMAVATVGGVAALLGRSKSEQPRVNPADIARTLDNPKVRTAVQAAQRALDEARDQLSARDGHRLQEELSRRAEAAFGPGSDAVSPAVRDASDLARELAERLRVEGQARSAELSARIRADVAPRAKTFAQEAIEEAEDILSTARQRAAILSKNARRDYGPEVSNKANALAGIIAAGSSTGAQMLRQRTEEMTRQNKGKRGRKSTNRAAVRATSALQTAGGQAKYVATESLMIGAWAGVLGATIYLALLTRRQRERVKEFFGNAFSQIQDVLGDFQDVGNEFPGSTR